MTRLFILWLLALAAAPCLAAETAEPARISALIVDGMNNHDWPRATGILRRILDESGLFRVEVATSPSADAPDEAWDRWRPKFEDFNVVVMNFNGGHKPSSRHWPEQLEAALEAYVERGGGLVIYHSANNSFPNWSAYNEMIGLGWRDRDFGPGLIVGDDGKVVVVPKGQGRNPGHGPEHDFLVTVLNQDHPINRGLPKTWMHPHEQLTHGQHGPAANMTVLSYAWSKDTGDNEVVDWVIPHGKGRVYVTMLGHLWKNKPDSAMRCVGFQTMLIRGCQWAANGEVGYPVPENFPTATEMKLRAAANVKKPEDRVTEIITAGGTVLNIESPSGIGAGSVAMESWPENLRLRLHLHGLESLAVTAGEATFKASVLSHGGNRRLLSVVEQGREREVTETNPYWTEIEALDAGGKPAAGLPPEGGYFELVLPRPLVDDNPEKLEIRWIDFYR